MDRLYCAFFKNIFGTFRHRELWGSFFDLWFLVPITGILVDSETGGDAHSLGRNFLYLGGAYLLSSILFRTPLPIQPLKVWAFLFLILHPTPLMASMSAVLLGFLLFLAGQMGITDALSRKIDDAGIRGVKRAVSIYVYGVGVISISLWLLHHIPGIDLSKFSGSIPGIGTHSRGTILELFLLVLPQLPVTLVNGVLGTVREKRASNTLSEFSRARLTGNMTSIWLGLANVLAGTQGLLPFCHGSGGLWSYRRYSIRTVLPSIFSSIILITLGISLLREKITLPGPAFFALFLAGFLLTEFLLTRRESLKTAFGESKNSPHLPPLGRWVLSGGMLSALVALGGIPAVLVFFLGMNTIMTLSKTNPVEGKIERGGGVINCPSDIRHPVHILGGDGLPDLAGRIQELVMVRIHDDEASGSFHSGKSLSPPAICSPAGIHLTNFSGHSPQISKPPILSSSPVRGDPERIKSMNDLYRRPREMVDLKLCTLLFLLFFFFCPLFPIFANIPKTSDSIVSVRKTFFSGPPKTRAP